MVRQRYHWGPRNEEFLALDDIELKLEYLRIRAWNYLEEHGTTPDASPLEGETQEFDDIVELMNSGLVNEDELWEELTEDMPTLPNASPIYRSKLE